MVKNSVCVVFNGRNPGMYCSWAECHAQVDGFPGALYHKFNSTDEAYKAIISYVHRQNSIESSETVEENVSKKEGKANPRVFFDLDIGGNPAGRLVIERFADTTPITAENFRALCTGEKGIRKNEKPLHYKGTIFPRVIPRCLLNGGDLTEGNGLGAHRSQNPPYGKYRPTNNSQFLICTVKTEWLDGNNVVFSQVVQRFDIMKAVEKVGSKSGLTSKHVTFAN
ncbi:hypothetical protein Dsin_018551 [Dipteronia sinensis]|uniref:Peptidyl-prolyl cis-trans isomerase n=1 Tax=Dipteronia sinensis TaxID=43782 RepID=A0AAE0E1W7_9ROSI|nr:hypothetical protein Dsin_018551 [Dipteronia sinensis]